jgi:hypothetical protein
VNEEPDDFSTLRKLVTTKPIDCKLKIFAKIELALHNCEAGWDRVQVIKDELIERTNCHIDTLLHKKSQLFDSIKASMFMINEEDVNLKQSQKVYLDHDRGIILARELMVQGTTSFVNNKREMRDKQDGTPAAPI